MRKVVSTLFLLFLALNCFEKLGSEAQRLDAKEVEALRAISDKLKKRDWDFSVDPCSKTSSWVRETVPKSTYANNVSCNCNSTVCHVFWVELKGQNLTGFIPDEFADLTFLTHLDLTRNYLKGPIPARWASLRLVDLSLLGNLISGKIPKEFGKITTLKKLVIDNNELQGSLPPELGNLHGLEEFIASSNYFTGEIPLTFSNLTNLIIFRIDGNPISGKIPDFIGNWKPLQRLDMQGTSMMGPIPSNISLLTNLTELRISDLSGPSMPFPALGDMTKMQILVLRNCLISGKIPDYIKDMTDLKTLDLSFNKLTGEIPDGFSGLKQLENVYLTSNMLTGDIPSWVQVSDKNLDLSYNNFTGLPPPNECGDKSLNFVASYSSIKNKSVPACLRRSYPCAAAKAQNYNLSINCGGEKWEDYEADTDNDGESAFYPYGDKWAYSSTGDFTGGDKVFIAKTPSISNQELYRTARLSPLSLKYYGICLQNGNYTVQLHFSEIMFNNDETFSSVGRRIFDVSIQGKIVLKDFNIEKNASGVGIPTIINFRATPVTNNTLEIHLYWAGKGTNAIPVGGVYGPLISAIEVNPEFEPDRGDSGSDSGLSAGAIVGIVAGCCIIVGLIILVFLQMKGCLGGKDLVDKELQGLELQTGYFRLRQIKSATNNFDPENKIGEGGFGPVYKGTLPDCSIIAVKQLSSKSKQGNREFVNEIGMISALQHPNLVKLFGCCIEGNQLLLIYEYMENNSLARALFGPEDQRLKLDWRTRRKIGLGIARGLAYLHEESRLKIVHRDIKATNILLDKDLNAKISDFGLAKLDEEENTHISTRIAGTIGYMAPEYAMRGYLTDKADVYSFGIVLLEIVSGESNTNYMPKEEFVYLLDWACVLHEKGRLLELVDPVLGSDYSKEEALGMLNLALLCTNLSPTLRPIMSSVVSILEGQIVIQAPTMKPASLSDGWR
ncbi:probable LRR receptor-like serine/threonine-protein kinase At1g53430 isoform X2 [Magnolia sinica]|uniref:probable LRR receptor-like serine/threonine-protein kinase At1g53430 isoform X2 n=1 Tax=Magnolia sinica TaxID=86752 RepID=UPI00265AAAF2|nr:probable LRR receptor-like serine/threonine-protein kinase At1g53430 isoform X2 [Magnolia sinica]